MHGKHEVAGSTPARGSRVDKRIIAPSRGRLFFLAFYPLLLRPEFCLDSGGQADILWTKAVAAGFGSCVVGLGAA